jgi:hypothetical protein
VNRDMKFSLKDLFVSVTFACFGAGCLATIVSKSQSDGLKLLAFLLIWPLFAAAIGTLLRQSKKYVSFVLVVELILLTAAALVLPKVD